MVNLWRNNDHMFWNTANHVKEILKIRCHICIAHHSSTISVWTWTESHKKETEHIHASAADLLLIRIGNLDWCKCGHWKNEARETDCLLCREVDAMLIALAKIPEFQGTMHLATSSFYGHLLDYLSHVLALSI